MHRQRFVSDKNSNGIQKLVDGSPYLPVPVNAQIIALLGKNIFLCQQFVVNPSFGNELEQQRCRLFARAAFLGQT